MVYQKVLPEKEAGIVNSMILGDKSLLDADMKTLYQESGIGHLLAISGLHITILCMMVYRFLKTIHMPDKFSVFISVTVLLLYGRMVDYNISTSRAIIMMILLLLARCIGKTYDIISAMAFSAVLILVQKPFAVYSCSFLLSFGAVAGIAFIQPILQQVVLGGHWKQKRHMKKIRRQEKEICKNHWYGRGIVWIQKGLFHLRSLFLVSLSVQAVIFPILCYFYYEIPVYGVMLNLFVIPLSSILVGLSFLGGIAGVVYLPAGTFLLGGVYYLLHCYEKLCLYFTHLPFRIWTTGKPSWWKLILYYFTLIVIGLIITKLREDDWYGNSIALERKIEYQIRILAVLPLLCSILLLIPSRNSGLAVTFLDVGQGDGIFIREEKGFTCLVDGGSSSESQVGKYRIQPFLKYHGIHEIDCIIVTHSDEDHISGIYELLEETEHNRLKVHTLFLPEVTKDDESLKKLESQAANAGVAVKRIKAGDVLKDGKLRMVCLYPIAGEAEESSNENSVVLHLQYDSFSLLLTGDLEGEGEQETLQTLKNAVLTHNISQHYTVLKAAHHGSKNSTTEEFLKQTMPEAVIISCGKGNRYGHPHNELLQRLNEIQSDIFRTDESGAVEIKVSGGNVVISGYRRKK